MSLVGLEPWPFTLQAGTLHAVPAGHSVNWLRSPLFNNVHLLNMYEIMCLYTGRIADRLLSSRQGPSRHLLLPTFTLVKLS